MEMHGIFEEELAIFCTSRELEHLGGPGLLSFFLSS